MLELFLRYSDLAQILSKHSYIILIKDLSTILKVGFYLYGKQLMQ